MVQKLPTFDFQILPDHNQLTIYAGLNEASWGDVVSVGSSILDRLEQARTSKLLVDLSQLNYMGSSQVALLVRVWKVLKARDGQVAVQVKSDIVHKVLTIAGLHTLWDIVPTRAAAQRALGVRVTDEPKTAPARPASAAVRSEESDVEDEETDVGAPQQDVSPVLIALGVVFAAFMVLVLGQAHIWPGPTQFRLALLMLLWVPRSCAASGRRRRSMAPFERSASEFVWRDSSWEFPRRSSGRGLRFPPLAKQPRYARRRSLPGPKLKSDRFPFPRPRRSTVPLFVGLVESYSPPTDWITPEHFRWRRRSFRLPPAPKPAARRFRKSCGNCSK